MLYTLFTRLVSYMAPVSPQPSPYLYSQHLIAPLRMISEVLVSGIHLPIRRCKFHHQPAFTVCPPCPDSPSPEGLSKVPPCQLDTLLLRVCCVMDIEKGATLAEFEV